MTAYSGKIEDLTIDGVRVRGTIWSTPTLSSPLEDLQAMRELVELEAMKPLSSPTEIYSEHTYWALYGAEVVSRAHSELLDGAQHNSRQCILCQRPGDKG